MIDWNRHGFAIVLVTCTLMAAVSARPYAGGWNDGSRLATVESLVERGTLQIDDSIFVKPTDLANPYRPGDVGLRHGTMDKLFIGGHYYSDKSPVPALYMAAVYRGWRALGGPSAAERHGWFCVLMTWASAGLGFVVAASCVYAIGRRLRLPATRSLLLAGLLAFGTVALPYSQHVNAHAMMLGTTAALFLSLLVGMQRGWPLSQLFTAGSLLGISYTLDLAAGPMLVLAISGFVVVESGWRRTLVVLLAAFPWFVLHHVVNYAVGGTFGPANAVPEYLAWPGSPFTASNMTGGIADRSIDRTVIYLLELLIAKKGFLGHNLLLLLPLAFLPVLLTRRYAERRLVIAGVVWCVGTWLLYGLTSTNLSGACCSVRWFVPLLAPTFLMVAIAWRDGQNADRHILVLGAGSLLLGISMAWHGPWHLRMIPGYAYIAPMTIVAWIAFAWQTRRQVATEPAKSPVPRWTSPAPGWRGVEEPVTFASTTHDES